MSTLLEAVEQLAEAERAGRKQRAARPLEAKIKAAARKTWTVQQRRVVAVLSKRRRQFTPTKLQEALAVDDFDADLAAALAASSRILEVELERQWPRAMTAGARSAATDLQVRLSFDLADERAIAWLESAAADRVAGINAETRSQIRTILTAASDEGWSYGRAAKAVEQRFAAFRTVAPQGHIRSRAELVAVTEVGDAYEAGRAMAIDDLVAAGVDVEKAWLAVGDEKVCAICGPNARAGWIDSEKAFPSGHDRPLGHPGCRCDMSLRPAT